LDSRFLLEPEQCLKYVHKNFVKENFAVIKIDRQYFVADYLFSFRKFSYLAPLGTYGISLRFFDLKIRIVVRLIFKEIPVFSG